MQSTAPLQAAARPPAPPRTSLRAELFDVVIPATGEPLTSRVCREQADEVCNRWNSTQQDTDGLAEVMQTRLSRSDSLPPTRDEIRRICAEIRSGWTAKEERQRRAIPPQPWLPPGALSGELVLAPAC